MVSAQQLYTRTYASRVCTRIKSSRNFQFCDQVAAIVHYIVSHDPVGGAQRGYYCCDAITMTSDNQSFRVPSVPFFNLALQGNTEQMHTYTFPLGSRYFTLALGTFRIPVPALPAMYAIPILWSV